MPLLALDVEGTIICKYDMSGEMDDDNRFPAIIAPSLANILQQFHEQGFTIVLATGTDNDNLKYYEREFKKAGIHRFITSYSPRKHDPRDTKADKIRKYSEEFQMNANEIYFLDDAKNNVQAVIEEGYQNAYQVTEKNPLEDQLRNLLSTLKQSPVNKNKSLEKNNWDALPPKAKSNIGIYFHLLPEREQAKYGDKTIYWSSLTPEQQQDLISGLKNENSEIRRTIEAHERSLNNHEEPRPSPEPAPNRYHPQQPQMAHELNEKDLITIFIKKHNSLSKFSLNSRIEKNPTSLTPIIENALRTDKNTTTLNALIELKWMTKNRGLAETAPPVFKDKFNKAKRDPMHHPAIKK